MEFFFPSVESVDAESSSSPASTAAIASAYSARSSASSTSSSSGKSSTGASSIADVSSDLSFFFPDAARTASLRMRLESDAISARSRASSLAHICCDAVTASLSFAVSLPSTAAYLSANAVRFFAASTASLPTVTWSNA